MKIVIRTSEGKNLRIPLPTWLLKLGSSKLVINTVKKYMREEEAQYLSVIDFDLFKYNLDILTEYKGLNIVDVTSKDGTEVKIIV